jgi:dihydroorotate dehydrogenase
MVTLTTKFAGLSLRNPVIAASSPATETVERIARCAEAGAAAVVTKSISCKNKAPLTSGCRRMFVDSRGVWGTSTFARETLSLDTGCALVAGARSHVDIPVIASVAGTDAQPDSWMPTCAAVCQAGADAIQLDFFYCPEFLSSTRVKEMHKLVADLVSDLPVPVIPKLNVDISARGAVELFQGTGVAGISLLDSVTVPPPIRLNTTMSPGLQFIDRPMGASLFGPWQLPLTLHYTDALATSTRWELMAGGGITGVKDAIELLIAGAATVQIATPILVNGFEFITTLVKGLKLFLEEGHLGDLNGMRKVAHGLICRSDTPAFTTAYAEIVANTCRHCGRCLTLAFCDAIRPTDSSPVIVPEHCDGCSVCAAFCPNHAIILHPVRHSRGD